MKQRMSASPLWFALSLTLATCLTVTGCKKDAAEEAEAASTEAPAETAPAETTVPAEAPPVKEMTNAPPAPTEMPLPAPGTDAVVIENRATPVDAAPGFDAKGFAGRYASDGIALDVTSDGMFSLEENGNAVAGTWTLMPGGKMIVLDPDSKGEADRRIEVVSKDSIKLVGTNLTLRRENPTP